MRIAGLVLLVSLLATLGLLACLAPVATPAPAVTPTPTVAPAWTPIPTPPPPTPRPGQTLLSTETVNFGAVSLSKDLDLKKGDVVMFAYTLTGTSAYIQVDDPTVPAAAALQRTSFTQPNTTGTRSFEAKLDGKYRLTGGVGPAGGASVVLKIEIYR